MPATVTGTSQCRASVTARPTACSSRCCTNRAIRGNTSTPAVRTIVSYTAMTILPANSAAAISPVASRDAKRYTSRPLPWKNSCIASARYATPAPKSSPHGMATTLDAAISRCCDRASNPSPAVHHMALNATTAPAAP